MALDTLSSGLQALGLHDPDSLLFNPLKDQAWLRSKFNSIPRYLFRVSTPVSYCTTDNVWVKSMDARLAEPTGDVDILSRHDNHEVANMLNSHLSWGKQPSDNFVSWTSSLLFALQYVIYLHKYSKETPSLEEINLCVIDTAAFPPGVFLQDLDLIDAYKSYNNGLQDLEGLRRRQYYFGEYLSQGALKIENKCQIVSTRAIFDRGLFSLQPEFNISMTNGKRTWAKEVLRLRESFSYYALITSSISPQEIQAAKSIAQLFGPRWRLPVAANLMALSPHRSSDPALRQVFKAPPFTGLFFLSLVTWLRLI